MFMKKYSWILMAILALAIAGIGCNKKKDTTDLGKAFASADANIKGNWEKAMTAMKANDYAGALTILQVLRNDPNLSADQWNAAQETFSLVMEKAVEAANRGDTNGQQAVELIKQLRGR